MNAVTQTKQGGGSPLQQFKAQVSDFITSGEVALPSTVDKQAFTDAVIVAATETPELMSWDRKSVFSSLRVLARKGLIPDGNEAALVKFKKKVGGAWLDFCQPMVMKNGLITAARRTGIVDDVRAYIVYEKEVETGRFSATAGDNPTITHEPIFFGDKGRPVGAYAIVDMKNGVKLRAIISAEEIEEVRRMSSAQRVYQKGKPPVVSEEPIGIWKDHWRRMWEKTAIRRVLSHAPLSAEDRTTLMTDEDARTMKDVTPKGEEPAPEARVEDKRARLLRQRDEAEAALAAPEEIVIDEDRDEFQEGFEDFVNLGSGALPPNGYEGESLAHWEAGKAKAARMGEEATTSEDEVGGDEKKQQTLELEGEEVEG